jgi:hypothetical protein
MSRANHKLVHRQDPHSVFCTLTSGRIEIDVADRNDFEIAKSRRVGQIDIGNVAAADEANLQGHGDEPS